MESYHQRHLSQFDSCDVVRLSDNLVTEDSSKGLESLRVTTHVKEYLGAEEEKP